MHVYKILSHVSCLSIIEILFYFYYIGPLETKIFTEEFKNLLNSLDKDIENDPFVTEFKNNYVLANEYNETLEQEMINKQKQSLKNMEDEVDKAIKRREEYNYNLFILTIEFWCAYNFLVFLVFLVEYSIQKYKKNNIVENLNTENTSSTENSNIELVQFNRIRINSTDSEIDNENADDYPREQEKKNQKKKYLFLFIKYLAIASTILIFQYLFITYIILKYHILTGQQLKYLFFETIFPIFNSIFFS